MKSFYDLTDKEILALTNDEIKHYCDIELMKEGVIKPVAPIPPVIEPIELHYNEFYCVSVDYTKLLFKSLEDAEKFASMNVWTLDTLYDFPEPNNQRAKPPYSPLSIEKRKIVTEDDVVKYRAIFKKQKNEQTEYEKLNKEYEKSLDIAEAITDEIYKKVNEVDTKDQKMKAIRRTLEEYLKLTEGNEEIAMNFLKKAYPEEQIAEMEEWFAE